jgi:hypothetical protein
LWQDFLSQHEPADAESATRLREDKARTGQFILQAASRVKEATEKYRKVYLEGSASLQRQGDVKRYNLEDIGQMCGELQAFNGYVFIATRGAKGGHAIAGYFGPDGIRIMDPNHGEISVSMPSVVNGLTEHLTSQNRSLGSLKSFEVDYYPFPFLPGELEQAAVAAATEQVGDAQATPDSPDSNPPKPSDG